jgi:septal ring factor EnvC (AmiA/AmiB activator)
MEAVMKKLFALMLVLALATPALAQSWYDRDDRNRRDRWQQEDEMRRQEQELRRQRYEMEDLQHRLREAEAERDRLRMEQHDLERERGYR